MEPFVCKTRIYAGRGSLSVLREAGIRKPFLVADPYFAENGTARQVLQLTGASQSFLFSEVKPDPDVQLVARAAAQAREFAPDAVIALGGGSALDCGKAVSYFQPQPVRLIAIPTTSGSGSEVTDFAVLSHDGVKHPLVDERLQPELAILDADLTDGMPPSLVAATGFDAIAHAVESFVGKNASPFTDALACDAFCTLTQLLPQAYRADAAARQPLHTASCMAGLAFARAGLGLCHALSHSLGGLLHLPHGVLNAILLPEVIGINAQAAGEKYLRLCRASGLGGAAASMGVRNLRNGLCRLRRELGLPQSLQQAGADLQLLRQHRQQLVKTTLEDPCCLTNPIPVEPHIVLQLLDEVAGNG